MFENFFQNVLDGINLTYHAVPAIHLSVLAIAMMVVSALLILGGRLIARLMDKLISERNCINAIFECTQSGMVVLEKEVIVRCNAKAEEMFGYAFSELDGKSTRLWYSDETAYATDSQKMMGDSFCRLEQQLTRKDGRLFWARLSGQVLDKNTAKSVLVIIDDISAEHESAQVLQAAKEFSNDTARMKANFMGNMNHEIRTPMNAMIGLGHLLTNTDKTAKEHDDVRKIQASSQLEQLDFNLEFVLNNIFAMIEEKAIAKGLRLTTSVAADVPFRLKGDPLRLGQILSNFAYNAIKFTHRGNIDIVIENWEETEYEVLLKLTVKDTGIGLSSKQCLKLFQSDSSINRKDGSTELGLAICKSLAEKMGGSVGVSSELGKGSKFWFTVRLGKGVEEPSLPKDFARAKVLLVEDNEINQLVAKELLVSAGFLVDVAVHGLEAIEKIQQQHYDLVLMDMQMPVMDGVTATLEIRKNLAFARLPIVAMTASTMPEDYERCLLAGMNDHITKPIDPVVLSTIIHKWMSPRAFKTPVQKSTEASDEATIVIPNDIKGLDTKLGLQRVLNKRKLYLTILHSFVNKQQLIPRQIKVALANHDIETAERLTHTLKALYGNIGAEPLQAQAAELEAMLHGHESCEKLNMSLTTITQAHEELIAAIRVCLIPLVDTGVTVKEINTQSLKAVVSHLSSLLHDDDAEAVDYLEAHEQLLKAAFPEQFWMLQQAIDNYDFSNALFLLEQGTPSWQTTS